MLQIHNVTAGYGSLTVLSDVSLSLPAGARLGVFGHNGAGKTTLLRCIVGAVRPSSGTISVDLPLPLVPSSTTVSPELTLSDTSSLSLIHI